MICIDKNSKQLFRDSRASLPMKAGAPAKLEYEYVREGYLQHIRGGGAQRRAPGGEGYRTPNQIGFRQLRTIA